MTALDEYQKLECSGIWRAGPEDQRRDVVVSLGDATLVIYDSANRALAHWSLPALIRRNPGKTPALYGPGAEAPEELEVAEDEMISAIETIRKAIDKRRPKRGFLRIMVLGSSLAAILGLGVYLVPDALIHHAASVVPEAKRNDISNRLLTHIQRLAGTPCSTPAGDVALARLYSRLRPGDRGQLVVLGSGAPITGTLPGGVMFLNRNLVEDFDSPDVVAGYILAESIRADASDPIHHLLSTAGPVVAGKLLTTGDVPESVLATHAEALMTMRPAPVDEQDLLARFKRARVSSSPYAFAKDISGETTIAMIEADPGGTTPVLADEDWINLQGICDQ